MKEALSRLRAITVDCREDMHEPDEQDVSARVVGDRLDNAFGAVIMEAAIVDGYQELVVILKRGARSERFNLATLIALARKADLGMTMEEIRNSNTPEAQAVAARLMRS